MLCSTGFWKRTLSVRILCAYFLEQGYSILVACSRKEAYSMLACCITAGRETHVNLSNAPRECVHLRESAAQAVSSTRAVRKHSSSVQCTSVYVLYSREQWYKRTELSIAVQCLNCVHCVVPYRTVQCTRIRVSGGTPRNLGCRPPGQEHAVRNGPRCVPRQCGEGSYQIDSK